VRAARALEVDMAIYMKAGSITGDVSAGTNAGWVELENCKFELKVDVKSAGSAGGAGATPKPELVPLNVSKRVDSASPHLMNWKLSGDVFDDVTIEGCKEDGQTFLRFILKKVTLKEFTMKMSDGSPPEDSLVMEYEEIVLEQFTYNIRNQRVSDRPNRSSYKNPNPKSKT
jgi:type VI protein secretion system component Hcp